MEYVTLNDGRQIPKLGFGTYRIKNKDVKAAVATALQRGYRLIDTAQWYKNERGIGEAIKESGINREEIFISSKVFPNNYGYYKTLKAINRSLRKLRVDYLDLMLLHQGYGNYNGAWAALIDAQRLGLVKSIGISNFTQKQIDELTRVSGVKPVINQIEISPFYQRDQEVSGLQQDNIAVESWASFANGKNNIFSNELIKNIGKKYNKNNGQVILRWLLQRNIIVLPKSVTPSRIQSNIDVFDFELNEDEMRLITQLDKGESQFGGMHLGLYLLKFFTPRNKPFNKVK